MGRGRRWLLVTAIAATPVAVAAVSGWHDLRSAEARLTSARRVFERSTAEPTALETHEGRMAALVDMRRAVIEMAAARRRLQRSPVISAVRLVPALSGQRAGLLQLVDDALTGARSASGLVGEVDQLAAGMRVHDGVVPLTSLQRLGADLRTVTDRVKGLARPSRHLWGGLGGARKAFDRLSERDAARLGQATDVVESAQTFMGAGTTRRYLLALENNAEMRDQGMVLSYAVIRFDHGRLTFERRGHITDLALTQPVNVAMPAGTREVFGSIDPTQLWQSVNANADFAWSAAAMRAMFLQATGIHVDGVIALDVPGLADALRVVGPVAVPGIPEPLTAANASRLLLHDLYDTAPTGSQDLRHERVGDAAEATIRRLINGDYDAVAVRRELAKAASGGHLRVWSADRVEQQAFDRTDLGASPAGLVPDRTFHVALENRSATKMDYYVHLSVSQRVRLTDRGTAIIDTVATVINDAPAGATSSYQLGPDGTHTTSKPGDYLGWVLLWGPVNAVQPGSVEESGLRLSQQVCYVPAKSTRSITFETILPRAVRQGHLLLRYAPQPRLDPASLSVTLDAPAWVIRGTTDWQRSWDQPENLSWSLTKRPSAG